MTFARKPAIELSVAGDDRAARAVLAALQSTGTDPEPLSAGLSSNAWRVRSASADAVLRIPTLIEDGVGTYPIEHALLARLTALGAPVPAPVNGSWLIPGWQLAPFSLTAFVAGTPLRQVAHDWAAAQIAMFLRQLHSIPAAGHGPLVELDGRLVGGFEDVEAGLAAAFGGFPLWPFNGARAEAQPALVERPELLAAMVGYAPVIREAAAGGPTVIVHSDLHEENILEHEGRLGFIDFGECFLGAAGWEFAALAYFGGWPLAERVLVAYLADRPDLRLIESIPALALSFGLYRWQQDRRLGIDEEAHNEAFLRQALARL